MALPPNLKRYVDELRPLDRMERYLLLLDYADTLGGYPEALKDEAHRVRGCVSQVWLAAAFDGATMHWKAAADGQIAAGMAALLVHGLSGEPPGAVLAVDPAFIREAGLAEALTPGRQGGLAAMLARMHADARAALEHAA
jgi:cysteine desulfuration protein SufE